jgi:hypothetical protein
MKDLQNVRRRATHAAKVARMVAAPSSVVGKNIYSSLSRREAFAVCFTHSVYQTINTLTVSFPRSVADLATCRKDTAERTLNYPNRRYDVPREK